MFSEDPLHGAGIAKVCEQQVIGAEQAVALERQLQRVQCRLIAVQLEQLRRLVQDKGAA